jgi:hypothetical protein
MLVLTHKPDANTWIRIMDGFVLEGVKKVISFTFTMGSPIFMNKLGPMDKFVPGKIVHRKTIPKNTSSFNKFVPMNIPQMTGICSSSVKFGPVNIPKELSPENLALGIGKQSKGKFVLEIFYIELLY